MVNKAITIPPHTLDFVGKVRDDPMADLIETSRLKLIVISP
jgi:hypothetical protein